MVKVYLAVKRRMQPGDKMAGRHGNKGVISTIVPVEDMPYLEDGTPVDIVLNPLGVPSRMNVGQVLETHLGWAAKGLGLKIGRMIEAQAQSSEMRAFLGRIYNETGGQKERLEELTDKEFAELAQNLKDGVPMATPVFDGAGERDIKGLLELAEVPTVRPDLAVRRPYRRTLRSAGDRGLHVHAQAQPSGRRQDACPFDRTVQPGHAAAAGRQGAVRRPALRRDGGLGSGGLWRSLYAAGMLTVKSTTRSVAPPMYKSIVDGNHEMKAGMPESFNVLVKEIRSLGINVELEQD